MILNNYVPSSHSLSFSCQPNARDSYKQRAIEISQSFRYRLSDPLSSAVYWTEFVAEHGGNLLRSESAVKLNFFNYHSFDVILVVLLSMFVTILLLIEATKAIAKLCMRIKSTNESGDIRDKKFN